MKSQSDQKSKLKTSWQGHEEIGWKQEEIASNCTYSSFSPIDQAPAPDSNRVWKLINPCKYRILKKDSCLGATEDSILRWGILKTVNSQMALVSSRLQVVVIFRRKVPLYKVVLDVHIDNLKTQNRIFFWTRHSSGCYCQTLKHTIACL